MLELINAFLLSALEFDVNLKIFSVKFYLRVADDPRCTTLLQTVYPSLVTNINLLSGFEETKQLLVKLMRALPK